MKLNIIHEIPPQFFEINSTQILEVFNGPTLIHLKSKSQKKSLFLSSLLHGNETTSFYVIQKFLRDKDLKNLEKDILIFVGNVEAAAQEERLLNHQPDFNRIWSDANNSHGAMAKEVIDYAKANHLYASIDIHNNTGHNPYYACVNKTEHDFVALASMFAPYVVYFTEPHEVQSMAFANFVPAVTLECGIPGVEEGINYVTSYLNKVYALDDLNAIEFKKDELKVYQTTARLILEQNISVDYEFNSDSSCDVSLRTDIDDFNFQTVNPAEVIALTNNEKFVRVINNDNLDVTADYLTFNGKEVAIKKAVVPAMLTTDGEIALQDCLGYFMQANPL